MPPPRLARSEESRESRATNVLPPSAQPEQAHLAPSTRRPRHAFSKLLRAAALATRLQAMITVYQKSQSRKGCRLVENRRMRHRSPRRAIEYGGRFRNEQFRDAAIRRRFVGNRIYSCQNEQTKLIP